MNNKLRQALLDRKMTLGAWMQIGHPACAEVFVEAGFDWVCVDLEHGAIDLETMAGVFRAMGQGDCVPVVRVPANDAVWIRRSLDAGARGLIVPMVNTAAEAERAVREAKYPPRGVRGFGYSRANVHGMRFTESIRTANDDIAVIVQIEHKDAIANVEQIASVPDVDGLFIGPLDLSGSMGVTGQMDHPEVAGGLMRFRNACASRGKSAGIHVVRPDERSVRRALEEGYTLLALGVDNVFLEQASRAALKAAGR